MLFKNILHKLCDLIFFILIAMLLAFQYSQVLAVPTNVNLTPDIEAKKLCAKYHASGLKSKKIIILQSQTNSLATITKTKLAENNYVKMILVHL